MGPQGAGPCARDKDIVSESWLSKWTKLISHGTLRSHVILGVMLDDLSLVQEKRKRRKGAAGEKERIVFDRTIGRHIVTEEVGVNDGSSRKSHSLTFQSCDCTAEYGIRPIQIQPD